MCLAIPYKVLEITEHGTGIIEIGGLWQEISIALVPEVNVGDWVLAYCGTATTAVDEEEAKEILNLFEEISRYDPIETSVTTGYEGERDVRPLR